MVKRDHGRTVVGLAVALLTIVGLSACSTADSGAGTLTLAQTKSPVQLLRNEAANRIGNIVVGTVDSTSDVSKACKTAEADPKGLSRSWTSSISVSLATGTAWRLEEVAQSLITSFTDQGWTAERGIQSDVSYTGLKSDTSSATIGVTSKIGDDAAGVPAELLITTNGPCVATDGAESDEVKKLEAASASD
jgi:hypothetical protein